MIKSVLEALMAVSNVAIIICCILMIKREIQNRKSLKTLKEKEAALGELIKGLDIPKPYKKESPDDEI